MRSRLLATKKGANCHFSGLSWTVWLVNGLYRFSIYFSTDFSSTNPRDSIFSYWEETHNPSHIEKIAMESPFLIQIPPTNQHYNNSLLSLGTHLLASINTMHMHRWFSAFLLPKSALPMRTPARTNSPSAMAQFRHYACCGKCILMHDSFRPSDTLYLL